MTDLQVEVFLARADKEFKHEGEFIEEYERLFLKVAIHRGLISMRSLEEGMWLANKLVTEGMTSALLPIVSVICDSEGLSTYEVGQLHRELLGPLLEDEDQAPQAK